MSDPNKDEQAKVSSALCSALHALRTLDNSGAYFLTHLNSLKQSNPNLKLLDVGSGYGHMALNLAQAVGPSGHVTGLDIDQAIISKARELATQANLSLDRVEFIHGDGYHLPFPDGTFDITHCHQVLAHLAKPWDVMREMVRVTKPGGFVAIREGDLDSEVVWPREPGLVKFHELIATAMRARGQGGGGANTGRQLLPWALRAGVDRGRVRLSYGTWWFSERGDKEKWGKAMAAQVRGGMVAGLAKKAGLASESDLVEMADAWDEWVQREDSSLAMMHGEIVIQK